MYVVLGFVGAAALVAGAALMTRTRWLTFVRYCGEQSIVIYLAFFIPMAATRILLIKTGVVRDIGAISAIVTVAAVTGPLVLYWIVRRTPLRWLFERPRWFSIARSQPTVAPELAGGAVAVAAATAAAATVAAAASAATAAPVDSASV
jgi:uncharacterized membrane protein YcfT